MEQHFQQDIDEWAKNQSDLVLFFVESIDLPDDRLKLEFSFCDDESSFSFICNSKSIVGNSMKQFSVVSDCARLKSWLVRMQAYLNENSHQIKLAAVLNQAVQLYRHPDSTSTSWTPDVDVASTSTTFHRTSSTAAMSMSEEESDDDGCEMEFDEDDFISDAATFTTDWEIAMTMRKKKWFEEEVKLRSKLRTEAIESCDTCALFVGGKCPRHRTATDKESDPTPAGTSSVTSPPEPDKVDLKAGQQIFQHDSAAYQILSNEMIQLLKHGEVLNIVQIFFQTGITEAGEDDGYICDTINNSLYSWSVKMNKFPSDSSLYLDLQNVQAKFGYDFIELQLDFVPDYPFYPPMLRVGSLVQSLASIDLLKLSYWNPARSMLEVFSDIRSILLNHARLFVDAPQNDLVVHPEGAYLPLEDALIKLALTAEIRPRANYGIIDLDHLEKAPEMRGRSPTPKTPFSESKKKGGWAKGIGYTSGIHTEGSVWDIESFRRAEQEKQKQILQILTCVTQGLSAVANGQFVTSDEEVYEIVEGSCFLPYLQELLNDLSVIDLYRMVDLYMAVMTVLESMSNQLNIIEDQLNVSCLLPLVRITSESGGKKQSLFDMLVRIKDEADAYLKLSTREVTSAIVPKKAKHINPPIKGISGNKAAKPLKDYLHAKLYFTAEPDESSVLSEVEIERKEKELSTRIIQVCNLLVVTLDSLPSVDEDHDVAASLEMSTVDPSTSTTPTSPSNTVQRVTRSFSKALASVNSIYASKPVVSVDVRYKQILGALQYASHPVELSGGAFQHKYHSHANDPITHEARAIFKECQALKRALPLDLGSSVFVRCDEDHLNLLRVLITGPEDTPYANGCFLFDVCFPPTFPRVPPLVSIVTTGGGQVRFNPNLYACGKVCLSLLGTWSGHGGEKWNDKTSTLLQVLVSIQSLILVQDPYFNEPGFESTMGTKDGNEHSARYNAGVKTNCLKWAMLEMIKCPPPAFKDIVFYHFKMKKDIVIEQVEKWAKDDSKLKSNLTALKSELTKLCSEVNLPDEV